MSDATRVYLEVGAKWTFAGAIDWPGWCRRGRSRSEALDALRSYRPRYATVAGPGFAPGELAVVGEVGGDATTDFGAPGATGAWDDEVLSEHEADRLTGLLEATWRTFDTVVAVAPAVLAKGPRGGGRDRDGIVDHVREAERSYARKIGVRLPPRTPWNEQRRACAAALRAGAQGESWSVRFAVRRIGWHVMDHAWEVEDRSS